MAPKLTKLEIISRLTKNSTGKSLRPSTVKFVVQSVFDMILETLRAGGTVEIRDFGVFKVIDRKAKLARNPKTMEEVMVPPRKVIKFVSGRTVKKSLQNTVINT